VPSLDDIARDPARAAGLPPETLAALTSACIAVLTNIMAQLAILARQPPGITVPTSHDLLTAKQVAVLWNVPETWVLEQARVDKLPSVRLGHYVRFRLAELERAMRDGLTDYATTYTNGIGK
jgi:hypothetical protein